ncbi:VPS4-associated protein 1 [Aspergillus recurvatus]
MTTLPNIWHLRRVADTAAKACLICHKPSSSVLITPNSKDYFYVCPVHLKDRQFCSPIVDAEEEAAKKKAEAMAREIEKVKKEYEEKQQRKKEKEKEKKKDDPKDDNDKDKDDSSERADDRKEEKERDDKINAITKQSTSTSDYSPRIFALHKNFYQMRVDRMRNIEAAKRNRQRLQDPSFFPSVPSGGL